MLLWLWYRPAAAAPIQPLAWELPYAESVALKRHKNKISNSNASQAISSRIHLLMFNHIQPYHQLSFLSAWTLSWEEWVYIT